MRRINKSSLFYILHGFTWPVLALKFRLSPNIFSCYKASQEDNIRLNLKSETLMKIDTNTPSNEMWRVANETLQVAARNTIPTKKLPRPGKGWMTEDIPNLMEERR